MNNGDQKGWLKFIERHGFGTFVALLFILSLLGILPAPLINRLVAHTDRDPQRDALMFAVCLNLAKDNKLAEDRCWNALAGTGDIARAVKDLTQNKR